MACQWLEGSSYTVYQRGTVVSMEGPWLSASPDGLLNSEQLLKVKCPILAKGCESLEELFIGKTKASQQELISVPYNTDLCAVAVPRLKAFYFTHMLHHIVDEFEAGRLSLSDRYMQLCKS